MARDAYTEAIFTTAATDVIAPEIIANLLPQQAYPLTHEWVRRYQPQEMAQHICDAREFLLCRSSVVALVTVMEAALQRFNAHLYELGLCRKVSKNRKLLEWSFGIVKNSPVGSHAAVARLPQTCGDLDNARRLRNCIVHNNGCYDDGMYLKQVLVDDWLLPQYEKDSLRATAAHEPILLTNERFEYFSRSHIEFLHVLHNSVQQSCFGHTIPYNYSDEGKRAEWYRIISGRHDVRM